LARRWFFYWLGGQRHLVDKTRRNSFIEWWQLVVHGFFDPLSAGNYFVGPYGDGNAVQDMQYNASITTFSPLT